MAGERFRKVNPYFDQQPKLGPFPADQVLPWCAILAISYYIVKGAFGASWLWTGLIAAWGMGTWWILTGSKGWKFLSKFVPTPYWVKGYGRYRRFIEIHDKHKDQTKN